MLVIMSCIVSRTVLIQSHVSFLYWIPPWSIAPSMTFSEIAACCTSIGAQMTNKLRHRKDATKVGNLADTSRDTVDLVLEASRESAKGAVSLAASPDTRLQNLSRVCTCVCCCRQSLPSPTSQLHQRHPRLTTSRAQVQLS